MFKVYVDGAYTIAGKAIVEYLKSTTGVEVLAPEERWLKSTDRMGMRSYFSINAPNVVVMAGGDSGGLYFNKENSYSLAHSNALVTLTLLDICREFEFIHTIIYIGSACMYPKAWFRWEEKDLMSAKLTKSNAPYATAKLFNWQLLEAFSRQYDRKVVTLIPANLLGYDQYDTHMISEVIRKLKDAKIHEDSFVEFPGTGTAVRSFINPKDLASAVWYVINNEVSYGVYNVTEYRHWMIMTIIKEIAVEVGYVEWDAISDTVIEYDFEEKIKFDNDPEKDGERTRILSGDRLDNEGWMIEYGIRDAILEAAR